MKYDDIIKFAEKAGLLYKDEDYPYNVPAHQRLIARLTNFADMIEAEVCTQTAR